MADGKDLKQPSNDDFAQLQAELSKRIEKAAVHGLPVNKNALLRRIVQEKGQFFDSAEYVLHKGWPRSGGSTKAPTAPASETSGKEGQLPAYFTKPSHESAPSRSRMASSRFSAGAEPEEEEEEEEESS
ncbi:hypothetical protein ADUPG1_012327 [Aduncisulcus paluster]|uniref:Uncharacterized protein n=1 Tax=Aduncisulcus paluster TaxID=2918883 RepID=A0ABQ5JZ30_9EUKA|nr:hypothetical protein ADUPG1_012327 [Aduncisulcus paluster]